MSTTAITQQEKRPCYCGQPLQSDIERGSQCKDCTIQQAQSEETLNILTSQAQNQDTSLQHIAHMAHKATRAEREAIVAFSKQNLDHDPSFLEIDRLCRGLNHIANAFTNWAYVGERLWQRTQKTSNENELTYLSDLHAWSTCQFNRLITIHLTMQTRIHHICQQQRYLLTFRIIDQAADTKTGVPQPKEEATR